MSKEVEVEGVIFLVSDKSAYDEPLEHGDSYLAKRNTGWHLLTCDKQVRNDKTNADGMFLGHFVIAQELAYSYDSWECFKVLEIKEEL